MLWGNRLNDVWVGITYNVFNLKWKIINGNSEYGLASLESVPIVITPPYGDNNNNLIMYIVLFILIIISFILVKKKIINNKDKK